MGKRKFKPIAIPSRDSSTNTKKKKQKKSKKVESSEESSFKIIDSDLHTIIECSDDYFKGNFSDFDEILASKVDDPSLKASQTFEWLISPVSMEDFFEKYFEKKALLIRRNAHKFFGDFLPNDKMEKLLSSHQLSWGTDLLTDPLPKLPKTVKVSDYQNVVAQQTVELPHPEHFSKKVWKFFEQLEEFWGVPVLGTVSWSPSGNHPNPHHVTFSLEREGPPLAPPHAFLLGLEGDRPWELLWDSNFRVSVPEGPETPTLKMKEILRTGDLWYIPPGWKARPIGPQDSPSSHVTIQVVPHSWAEFLQTMLSQALDLALDRSPALRSSLPLGYLLYSGGALQSRPFLPDLFGNSGKKRSHKTGKEEEEEKEEAEEVEEGEEGEGEEDEQVERFNEIATVHLKSLLQELPTAAAADELGVASLLGRLPPLGPSGPLPSINRNSFLRLVAPSVVRMAEDGDELLLYCRPDNDRRAHGVPNDPPSPLTIPRSQGVVIEMLLSTFPQWIRADQLPGETTAVLELLRTLLQKKVIVLDL